MTVLVDAIDAGGGIVGSQPGTAQEARQTDFYFLLVELLLLVGQQVADPSGGNLYIGVSEKCV